MIRPYQLTALVLFAIATFVGYHAVELRFYTSLGPGAGFFPLLIAIILGFLSVLMFAYATFRPETMPPTDFGAVPARGYAKLAAVVAALLLTGWLIERVGFLPVTFTLFIVLLLAFGDRGVLKSILLAAVFSAAIYYGFAKLLGVNLPVGVWPF